MDDTARLLGDQSAWLHALTRSLVADADLAADIAQETLLVAWRRRLVGVADVRSWLATVARHRLHRTARQRMRRERREGDLPPADLAPAAADVVAKAASLRDLMDVVMRLPEPMRTTLLLRYQEDLGYEELAARLQVSVEAIRSRIKRGLKEVRAELDARHGDTRAWAVPILGVTGFHGAAASKLPAATKVVATGATGAAGVLTMVSTKAIWLVPVFAALAWWLGAGPQDGPPLVVAAADEPAVPDRSGDDAAGRSPVAGSATGSPGVSEPTASRGQRVRGRVVDDVHQGGVAHALVQVLAERSPLSADLVVLATAYTAADGAFGIDLPLPAPMSSTFASIAAVDHAPRLLPCPFDAAATPPVTDLGEVRLASGCSLSGQVRDAAGQPVPEADLYWSRQDGNTPRFLLARAVHIGRADAAGRFELPGRFAQDQWPQWLIAVGERSFGWRRLDVPRRAGELRDFDVMLRRTVGLQVRVVDELGRPRAGLEVGLWPESAPLSGPADLALTMAPQPAVAHLTTAITDVEGVASMPYLPIGEDAPVYDPGRGVRSWQLRLAGRDVRAVARRLSLDQPDNHVNLVVARGTSIALTGDVVDESGRPVPEARVTIGSREVAADEHGQFGVGDLDVRAGVLRLRAEAPGRAPGSMDVDATAVAGSLHVQVRLLPAETVAGVVVTADGLPVAGACVMCMRGVVTTGQDGRFAFLVAPGERLLLSVSPPVGSGLQRPLLPQEAGVGEHRVVLAGPEVGAAVTIDLVDRASGASLEPVEAVLRRAPLDAPRSPALRDGQVSLDRLPPGSWLVSVRTRQGHVAERRLVVGPGVPSLRERWELAVPVPLRVRIDRAGVRGPLSLNLRRAVAGAWVPAPATAIADGQDDAEVLVEPGDLRLAVMGTAGFGAATVQVAAGAAADVTVVLGPALPVAVEPPSDVVADLALECGERFDDRTCGTGSTLWLPPGTWTWRMVWSQVDGTTMQRGGAVVVGGADRASIDAR